jgi:dephospho-CoA kinase
MIIGLTGLFCSGKSTVENIIKQEYAFHVIDVDRIGHWALIQKKSEIEKNFGGGIITGNEVDRIKLGRIVFNDNKKLKLLNSIVHPVMIEKVKNEIKINQKRNILINAALLFEMGLSPLCSLILVIKAPILRILIRALNRNNLSLFQVLKILLCQKVLQLAKKNEKKADIFYVYNNKDLNYLKTAVKGLFLKKGFKNER